MEMCPSAPDIYLPQIELQWMKQQHSEWLVLRLCVCLCKSKMLQAMLITCSHDEPRHTANIFALPVWHVELRDYCAAHYQNIKNPGANHNTLTWHGVGFAWLKCGCVFPLHSTNCIKQHFH